MTPTDTKRPPRVLFVAAHTSFFGGDVPPHGSGAHVESTLAALRKHQRVLAFLGESAPPSSAPGALRSVARRLPERLRGARRDAATALESLRLCERALRAAVDFEPDVVYERSEYFTATGALLARRLGVPLILEVDGPLAADTRSVYRSGLEPLGAALERWKVRTADALVVESPAMGELVVGLGGRADRIVVVPNAVSPDAVVAIPRPPREDHLVVGWVGHLMSWHTEAVLLLVEAARDVVDAVPGTRFRVVGGGPSLDELVRAADDAGLGHAFEFTGEVPRARLREMVADFDVGVVPLSRPWSLPVKLVDMGALGVPVVASETAALVAMLPAGSFAGFAMGDRDGLVRALLETLTDASRRAALATSLHAEIRDRFTWDATGDTLGALVRDLLS